MGCATWACGPRGGGRRPPGGGAGQGPGHRLTLILGPLQALASPAGGGGVGGAAHLGSRSPWRQNSVALPRGQRIPRATATPSRLPPAPPACVPRGGPASPQDCGSRRGRWTGPGPGAHGRQGTLLSSLPESGRQGTLLSSLPRARGCPSSWAAAVSKPPPGKVPGPTRTEHRTTPHLWDSFHSWRPLKVASIRMPSLVHCLSVWGSLWVPEPTRERLLSHPTDQPRVSFQGCQRRAGPASPPAGCSERPASLPPLTGNLKPHLLGACHHIVPLLCSFLRTRIFPVLQSRRDSRVGSPAQRAIHSLPASAPLPPPPHRDLHGSGEAGTLFHLFSGMLSWKDTRRKGVSSALSLPRLPPAHPRGGPALFQLLPWTPQDGFSVAHTTPQAPEYSPPSPVRLPKGPLSGPLSYMPSLFSS
ncbi:unnamed protein product [Nyctereutes procyonoides]|uniref:(raccoon dog) hypothetical protein n=1 Tax=Nyctereutes procyonoides TaxID=34880 RepID=A0A811ZYP2_NYCPR|nr:unnamed protein product [Nyctereutes procyonoides]